MTATLAAELDARAAHMVTVRAEYDLTKADHAREDGCDDCAAGIDPERIAGWWFDLDTNELLCRPCAYARKRVIGGGARTECANGHPWIPENLKERPAAGDRVRWQCRLCINDRTAASHAKRRRAVSAS